MGAEADELRTIADALAAETGRRREWMTGGGCWRTVVSRFEAGYGAKGHGLTDLLFDLQCRDAAQDYVDRASSALAVKLMAELQPEDDKYLANTIEWPRLLDYMDDPPPRARWWWYRMPSWGPVYELERRLTASGHDGQ